MAHELLAKSDHQLGMCLRMLYAEGIRGPLPVLKEKPSAEQPDRHREKSLHTESAGSFSFGFAGRTVAPALEFL